MLEDELMARDHWSREDLLAYQRQRVRALVLHAVTHSPYYREVLGADAVERPLAELPSLSKATLMAEFDRIVPIRSCGWPTCADTLPVQTRRSPSSARTG